MLQSALDDMALDAILCVAATLLLAYIPHWYRAFGVARPKLASSSGGRPYDLRYTRDSVSRASDGTPEGLLVARLTGCHQNGLEMFAIFAAAVACALAVHVAPSALDTAATLFLLSRMCYTYFYWTGVRVWKAFARSASWVVGLVLCFYILALAFYARTGTK